MAKKAKYLASALAALCIGAPVLAAQDPAPPANLQSEEQIIAWAKAARLTDDTAAPAASWNILGAVDEGLLWSAAQAPDAQGIAKVGIRLERFRPAGGVRSEAELFDLNCTTQQIRGTLNATFAEHNFAGAKTDRAVNAAWAPVASNEIVAAIKDEACKARAPAAAPTAGPPVNIADLQSIRRWMTANNVFDRNITGGLNWTLLKGTNEGVLLTGRGRVYPEQRMVEIVLRTEHWAPVPNEKIQSVLSELLEYEVNCTTRRMRQISWSKHSGRNLNGRSEGGRKIEEWIPIGAHPILGPGMESMCREFSTDRGFQTSG